MAKLEDLNEIIMHLCSDDSRYSTGSNYVVDGGYTVI
jgi:NAD(P)-dependent dehydrogenase (short-subunit alcohol dehydrogenase family)